MKQLVIHFVIAIVVGSLTFMWLFPSPENEKLPLFGALFNGWLASWCYGFGRVWIREGLAAAREKGAYYLDD